ncbi:MAG: hypothetical protein Q4D06_08710 [Coriobacteriia bacterium]|nr:hypothetical protein [Coriobacteriia bacterium]
MAKKYEHWDFERLIDELDEGVEDQAKLIRDVLRSGLTLEPDEAIELIYYDTDAEKEILDAVEGSFEPEQVAELRDYIGMDRLEELFVPKKSKATWVRQQQARPGRNSSGVRNGRDGRQKPGKFRDNDRARSGSGNKSNARGNRRGSRNKPNRSF